MTVTTELNRGTERALAEDLVQMFRRAAVDLGRRPEDLTIHAALSCPVRIGINVPAEISWREDWRRLSSRERPVNTTPFRDAAALRETMAAEGAAFLAGDAAAELERLVHATPKETLLHEEVIILGRGTRGHIVQECGHCKGERGFPCGCWNGKVECRSCGGAGDHTCGGCGGYRSVQMWNASANRYENVWCQSCGGSGGWTCDGCGGHGKVTCPSCDGSQWCGCTECGATGSVTYVGQAVCEAHLKPWAAPTGNQSYDPTITPGPVRVKFFLNFEDGLKGMSVQDVLGNADELRFVGPDLLMDIPTWTFIATVPFAKVEGECAGAPFMACMLGTKRRVTTTTRFGDAVLADVLTAIGKGAADPLGAITAAKRVPALSQVLDAAAGRSTKAVKDIETSLSWALSKEALEQALGALGAALGAVSDQAMRRAWLIAAPPALLTAVIWILATPGLGDQGIDAAHMADALIGAVLAGMLAFGVRHIGRRAVGAWVPSRAAPNWHIAAALAVAIATLALSALIR